MTVNAGDTGTAAVFNASIRRLLARGRRDSDTSTTTTEAGVLRLDDIPVQAGRVIQIRTSNLLLTSATGGDVVAAKVRITTDGSTPTTSSTAIGQTQGLSSSFPSSPLVTEYLPAADEDLSVLLTIAHGSGSGAAKILGATTWPILLYVYDLGPDTGDVGTEL